MTEAYLIQLNKNLYEDGKIRECQGVSSLLEQSYTSNLWEKMKKTGYKMELHKGLCNIKDNNNIIFIQAIGVPNALHDLALAMR